MAVSLVIPASRACVSVAGPTTFVYKQSHVGCFPVPCRLGVVTHELKSGYPSIGSLRWPPLSVLPTHLRRCPTLPGRPPPPTCWFSSLTSLQVFLWGETLVLPWLCLLGQMAHCGGCPAPWSRSATLCRLVLSVAQMGSEETSPALENSCSHVTNYAGDSNNLSPPQLRETFKARRKRRERDGSIRTLAHPRTHP